MPEMRSPLRRLAAVVLTVAVALAVACDDSALNELGAEGALQTSITIDLHDGWIGSPEATSGGTPEEPAGVHVQPHNDITFQITNLGSEPHRFALYADQAGTEPLASSSLLAPGGAEVVTFHFHDDQIAYFFDDQHRERMRGELYVHE
jgi:hypothetical protein